MKLPISVIVLTYNEEANIEACLQSVCDLVEEIFIVDSFSTDKTLDIVKKYTDKILQHKFENYGKQRNWSLDNLPIKTKWILNLDADHRVTNELNDELIEVFADPEKLNHDGFLISRKTIFMGRWIKHGGHYPVYHGILFKHGYGRCEESLYDQHFVIKGKHKKLTMNIEDIFTESLLEFTLRHNRWSTFEAINQSTNPSSIIQENNNLTGKILGNTMERRRFFKTNIYMKLPLFCRSFIYFFYRYLFKLGFLDGKEGLIFHFLQGFWFRFLIDAKIYEMKKNTKSDSKL